jgi:hypothetical protein
MKPSGKMWIQPCRREVQAEGAGKVSLPLVEYVRVPEANGSVISGDFKLRDGEEWEVPWSDEVGEKGCEERSRIA